MSVTAGNTANFGTVNVQVNGNASNCTITLSTAAVAGDTGLPAGATPSLTNDPNTTNAKYTSSLSVSSEASVPAGTYTFHVMATRAADCQGNGVVISTQQLILTVSSPCTAPSVTTQPSDQSIIYGANASFMAGASGSPAPTVQWQVNNGSGFTGIGGATSSTLSLSKPLVSASGNHYRAVFSNSCGSVNSDAATLTVAAKNLTVTGVTAFDKVYDGTTSATIDTSSADLNGVVSGDSVTLGTGGASGAFLSKTVGTAKTVQISGLTISGADAGNYSLTQPTTTADITAKELNVSFQANSKVYDRTTGATIKSDPATSLVGVVSGDVVTLDGSLATASFGSKDVGTGKTVTAGDFTKGGADAGNYVLASPQGTTIADITARDLTVTANGVNKVYDGARDATVTLTGDALSGDDVTVDYDSAAFADKNVGTGKPVSVSGISSSGADCGQLQPAEHDRDPQRRHHRAPDHGQRRRRHKVYDATTSSDETPTISSGSIAGGDSANFSQDFDDQGRRHRQDAVPRDRSARQRGRQLRRHLHQRHDRGDHRPPDGQRHRREQGVRRQRRCDRDALQRPASAATR